jgi:ATP-dependent DNA helicase PIF1
MTQLEDIKKLVKVGHNIFITGGGGVGKSYILDKLSKDFPIIKTSTTGVSALHIKGQTIHSWSSIGHGLDSLDTCVFKIYKNKDKYKAITNAQILAIDEISMLGSRTFLLIEEVIRTVRNIDKPFGGLQVILIGDFFQLPPVNQEEDFCYNTELWHKLELKNIILKKVYRQQEKSLVDTLNNIRCGTITNEQMQLLADRQCSNDSIDINAVRIYPTRKESNDYNEYCYNQLKGEEYTYSASDFILTSVKGNEKYQSIENVEMGKITELIYQDFSKNCMFEPTVKLKANARVMLLMNLDFDRGLVNGSCGTVLELGRRAVVVKFDNGEVSTIKFQKTALIRDGKELILRNQIPLKLAYSCTIHKVQGMSFDKIFIDLGRVFTSGQTYVGLSRVKSLDGLHLTNFHPSKIMANNNVVGFYQYLEQHPNTIIFN